MSDRNRYRLRTPSSGREVIIEADPDRIYTDRETGETYTVRSAYLIGSDGGCTVGDLVGIKMSSISEIRRVVSVHMSADLSEYFHDPEPMIRMLIVDYCFVGKPFS